MSETKEPKDAVPLNKMCPHWYLVGLNPQPCHNRPDDKAWLCMCCKDCQEECDEEEGGL